jgi:hypothetical protein
VKPLLLIDVDGPLNPWAASGRANHRAGYIRYRIEGFVVHLKKSHGQALLGLTDLYDLVWCTTWEHQANTEIGPRIGLPELPVIEFPNSHIRLDSRLYYKTMHARAYADDRPFAWVDDEVTDWDSQYLADTHEEPTLLVKTDPATGLTDDDFAALRNWAEGITDDAAA